MQRLNGQFAGAADYFNRVVDFLAGYQWIYENANTDILLQRVAERVPHQWTRCLNFQHLQQIQQAIAGRCPPDWPPDLVEFLLNCWNFSLGCRQWKRDAADADDADDAECSRKSKWIKVNPKKVHEVLNFSRFIGDHCRRNDIHHVVDIGAGLGYVDKELADGYHLHVLGLEQDPYRVATANQRAPPGAVFKQLGLNGATDFRTQVESIVGEWFTESSGDPASPLCMIGLHACGDLSPVMLKLLLRSGAFGSMMLVSCCYHRMKWGGGAVDDHFPLSAALRRTGGPFYRQAAMPYLFRLAAQETSNRWLLPHRNQEQLLHTFYRAILQSYSHSEGIALRKQQRKAVKSAQKSCMEDYIHEAIRGFGLDHIDGDHHAKMMDIYHQKKHLLPRLESLIILQVLMQPIAEALLLLDRVVYLEENGAAASLEQIFDDRISPRCYVTVAQKIK